MKIKGCVAMAIAAGIALVAFSPSFLVRAGDPSSRGRNITRKGSIVDLHTYMTGGEDLSEATKTSRKRIRGGVPVVLVTREGPVLLSQGQRSPARLVETFALQPVWAKGKYYEKDGLQYLDLRKVIPARRGTDGESDLYLDGEEIDDADDPPDE